MKLRFSLLCFVLLYGLFLLCTSCKKEEELLPLPYTFTENEGIVGKWLQTESYDHYDGIWHKTALRHAPLLEFSQDGNYIERGLEDTTVLCQGEYLMTKPDTIWMNLSCYTAAIETAIKELTPTILITQFQGRHGYVYKKYRAIK